MPLVTAFVDDMRAVGLLGIHGTENGHSVAWGRTLQGQEFIAHIQTEKGKIK